MEITTSILMDINDLNSHTMANRAIVEQLCKHPSIDKILKPVVTPEDFKSAFKCVPEKTA
jgi:hypothetical protein